MKRRAGSSAVAIVAVVLGGCGATVGSTAHVPEDAAATCAGQCSSVGLTLSAVVIMADNVGCVCEPPKASSAVGRSAAGAGGGMAAILMAQAASRRHHRD